MDSDVSPTDPGSSSAGDPSAPLIGTLEDYSPAGVLQVLSSQRETGAVRFNGEGGCTVYLHDGKLYFAETADTGEALAIALVRPGRLTPDQWDDATAAGYPTQQVGQELIDSGAIDRELLASVVLSVVYDPLIHLFRQAQGDFEFEPGTVHWMGPFRTFDVDAIVGEVRRRVREADEMAPLIPTLDVWVESAQTLPSSRNSVNLRRDDWEVVVAAAGGRPLRELAVELGRGVWSTARLVYRLASVDLLEIGPAPAEEAYTPESFADTTYADDTTYSDNGFAPAPAADEAPPIAADGFLAAPAAEPEEGVEASSFADTPSYLDDRGFASGTDVEADEADELEAVTDDDLAPVVDLSTPIATGDGPPALTDWEAPAQGEESWGETAWDDQPWDAPSSTPEGGGDDSWVAGGGWNDLAADGSAEPAAYDGAEGATGLGDDTTTTDDSFGDASGGFGIDLGVANANGITFEAPTLHPDIAKALAESTYADSATAINAMAARLGAAAEADDEAYDDDDEEWAAAPSVPAGSGAEGDEFEQFWSGDAEERAFPWEGEGQSTDEWGGGGQEEADDGLSWQPSSWDTGVETAPLPQRDRVRLEADEGPAGHADPEWLENLYSQFMANGEAAPPSGKRRGREANPVEAAFAASPEELPKTKPLRRVIAAIRRL